MLTVTIAEPLAAPPVEKFAPEAELFGEGQDHEIVAVPPESTLTFEPELPPEEMLTEGGDAGGGGGAQPAFDGVDAEHEPSHWYEPLFVWPQEFAPEVQDDP